MTRYVALLRGINVGTGGRRVAMGDLRRVLTELGYDDVTTILQSGNAVLTAKERSGTKVAAAIEQAIADELGVDVDVVVRSGAQMAKVVERNPFAERTKEPTKLHVAFLSAKLPAAATKAIAGHPFDPEEVRPAGEEIYAWYPNGIGRTKVTAAVWRKLLGKDLSMTDRNWNTVAKLAELSR